MWPVLALNFGSALFELEGVIVMQAVHVEGGAGVEHRVELHRHAESAKQHVSLAALNTCPQRHLQTGGGVHRPVNTADLGGGEGAT